MTDTPTPPDGWYPDPAGSGGLRRWNGTAWTDEVRPSAAEAPGAPAVSAGPQAEPMEPVAPPVPPGAPGSDAPAHPGAPAYPATVAPAAAGAAPGSPQYSGSGVPAYPGTGPETAASGRADIPTNTVWIWLVVLLPLLALTTLFLFDWRTYLEESLYASLSPQQAPYAASASLAVSAGASLFSFLIAALTVLFSFLDWRQLRARGIQKPFHWAWSFFVFVVSSGAVYIIGRGVILRRQTGKGLGPVWGWIAVMVVSVIAAVIWAVYLFTSIAPLLEQLSYSTGY
jgi:hypothetical protein